MAESWPRAGDDLAQPDCASISEEFTGGGACGRGIRLIGTSCSDYLL